MIIRVKRTAKKSRSFRLSNDHFCGAGRDVLSFGIFTLAPQLSLRQLPLKRVCLSQFGQSFPFPPFPLFGGVVITVEHFEHSRPVDVLWNVSSPQSGFGQRFPAMAHRLFGCIYIYVCVWRRDYNTLKTKTEQG